MAFKFRPHPLLFGQREPIFTRVQNPLPKRNQTTAVDEVPQERKLAYSRELLKILTKFNRGIFQKSRYRNLPD